MATSKVTEVVPGLVDAPEKGQFLVRKSTSEDENAEPFEMVLRVTGEDDYVLPVSSVEDGTLSSFAYSLVALRRTRLRETVVADNNEVFLTNK